MRWLKMKHIYEPRKIPVILSLDEVTRLLKSAGNLKHQAALAVAYGAGLRASEIVHLTINDIDEANAKSLRVEQGKGKRDRYAMLSPRLYEILRALVARRADHRTSSCPVVGYFQDRTPSTRCRRDSSTACFISRG